MQSVSSPRPVLAGAAAAAPGGGGGGGSGGGGGGSTTGVPEPLPRELLRGCNTISAEEAEE